MFLRPLLLLIVFPQLVYQCLAWVPVLIENIPGSPPMPLDNVDIPT